MMMGVGNLTELTDVDSAGVNTLLLGFCQELAIRSVLTTAVINWAALVGPRDRPGAAAGASCGRPPIRCPSTSSPAWSCSATPRSPRFGPENLAELAAADPRPELADLRRGWLIHALNNTHLLRDTDPFALFERMGVADPSHAFYLGYEMMKARTALTLSKTYRQDQALDWGFLTEPEVSHLARRRQQATGSTGTERTGRNRARKPGRTDDETRTARDPRRHRDDPEPGRRAEHRPDGPGDRRRT